MREKKYNRIGLFGQENEKGVNAGCLASADIHPRLPEHASPRGPRQTGASDLAVAWEVGHHFVLGPEEQDRGKERKPVLLPSLGAWKRVSVRRSLPAPRPACK